MIECSLQGKLFKVAVCINHQVFIAGKVVQICGMFITSSVHHKESCFKVEVCKSHRVFILGCYEH